MKEVRTKFGPMWVKPGDHISDILIEHECYELSYINMFIQNMANDEAVVLDIGANIGVFTVPFANSFKKVYAFEPQPEALKYLEKNVGDKENVEIIDMGVAHYNGYAFLGVGDEANMGSRGLKSEGDAITVTTLDAMDFEQIDGIKIDIEGAEKLAIFGARETIKKHKPMILYESIGHEKTEEKCGIFKTDIVGFDILSFLVLECEYSVIKRFNKNILAIP